MWGWPIAGLLAWDLYFVLYCTFFCHKSDQVNLFLAKTLFCTTRVLVFSTYMFLQFLRARVAVVARQPTAIQQHHNDNSSSSTSVSTRGRQRKQARMKEQVNCCREPAMYEYFIFLFSPFFVVPSSFTTYNIRKTRKILDFSKYGWHSAR